MTILDKHPAPWTYEDDKFRDANGVGLTGPAPMRLILAAPELLAHQRRCPVWLGDGMVCSALHPTKSRDDMLKEWLMEGEALIARVEGGK